MEKRMYSFSYEIPVEGKRLIKPKWWQFWKETRLESFDAFRREEYTFATLLEEEKVVQQHERVADVLRKTQWATKFQLEEGEYPTSYIPTGAAPATRPARQLFNLPSPSLFEEQRTNLIRYSE
jgi:hypothetical protein